MEKDRVTTGRPSISQSLADVIGEAGRLREMGAISETQAMLIDLSVCAIYQTLKLSVAPLGPHIREPGPKRLDAVMADIHRSARIPHDKRD